MFILGLLTLSSVNACDEFCASLCKGANGKNTCFLSCGCQGRQSEELADRSLKVDYNDYVKSKYDCYIEDVAKCEEFSTEDEYYNCLDSKGCIETIDIMHLFSSMPFNLIPAIEPSYVQLNWPESSSFSSCDECLYSQTSQEYYSCVYINCKGKIQEKFSANLLKLSDESICYDCGGYLNEYDSVNCIWFYCKNEVVQKNELFNSFYQELLSLQYNIETCVDCNSLVYADDYYNCVKKYCKNFEQKLLEKIDLSKLQDCLECEYLVDDQWVECYKSSCLLEDVDEAFLEEKLNRKNNKTTNLIGAYAGLCGVIALGAAGVVYKRHISKSSEAPYYKHNQ